MKTKYKVCVYAIALNEAKFVKRWIDSMKEADYIVVADTGSTDDTIRLLEENGAIVKSIKIKPWRFDEARNESMKLIPDDTDICVCTDLDEVFTPGWRQALEENWQANTTRMSYNYNWSFDKYGNPATSFYINKIHTLKDYKWVNAVHEVLVPIKDDFIENQVICESMTLNHYPDAKKSRGQYLNLLELSVRENPDNDRNMHYLGREYMYNERWNDCIDTLEKHLALPSATWKDERAASMRFIARSYERLNRMEEAKMWYQKAIEEAPYLREAYVELGILYQSLRQYTISKAYLIKALTIKEKSKSYINEEFAWNETIYDALSVDCFYEGNIQEAKYYMKEALKRNPDDPRIKSNSQIILKEE